MDLERRVMWVEAGESKNGTAFHLPLSSEAILVLRRQEEKHPRWVFTYQGRRVRRGNTKALKAALNRAVIADFRWHNLRRYLPTLTMSLET